MNRISPTYFEQVRYTLYNETYGSLVLETDPIGWDNDQKEYARNEEYHGIVAKFSNNLKIIGDGYDFIKLVYDTFDIQGQIKLTKDIKHPQTDKWVREYWGYLDLSTRKFEDGSVSIKFNSGGLEQALKSRENESVEIDRISTLDGTPIPELETKLVNLDGRRIFLKSKWKTDPINNAVTTGVFSYDGNTRSETVGFPLTLDIRSHEQAQSVIGSVGEEEIGSTGIMILTQFDRTRTIKVIGENLKFKFDIYEDDYQWAEFKVCLSTYANGDAYNIKNRIVLFFANDDGNGAFTFESVENILQTLNFEHDIVVDAGDSVAVEFLIRADLANTEGIERFYVNVTDCEGIVRVEEDSVFPASQSEVYLYHELLDRLSHIITNKAGIFKSDFFGRTDIGYTTNGPGAYNGVTHGFWVRGFKKLPISEDNKFRPLTTSFQDAIETANAIHNVSIGIEVFNNREILRVEDSRYFYQPVVTIRLPNQVTKLKDEPSLKKYYSSLEIGYEQGTTYEEAQGLDEPNGLSKFTSLFDRIKETFSKISKYRADSYGLEFARRKPESSYNTTDTSYDSDVFVLDLKPGITSALEQRKWQDDFAEIPTGIFSPETATNLRFSPVNMILRHGWWLASCLIKHPEKFLRYASSNANSSLTTKLIDGNRYSENGNILNSELGRARFEPVELTFEHECDFNIMQQIEGYTVINGKRVPNFYGLVEFKYKGETIKGFLLSVKPNGKGEWKILKYNN